MSDVPHPFFSVREYAEFRDAIDGQPTVQFPDRAQFIGMLGSHDFVVVNVSDLNPLQDYAGADLTAFEVGFLFANMVLDPRFAHDAVELTADMLLDDVDAGGMSKDEYMKRGLEIDALRVKNALSELRTIFDELYPDPVTAHLGLQWFEEAEEGFSSWT